MDRTIFREMNAIVDNVDCTRIPGVVVDYRKDGVSLGSADLGATLYGKVNVWPEVGVAESQGKVVRATTIYPQLLTMYQRRHRLRSYPVLPLPGTLACLNVHSSHQNFFHQWVDALPRAWVLSQIEPPDGCRVTLLVTHSMTPGFEAMARALAGPEHQILRVPRFTRIRPRSGYLHLDVPNRALVRAGSDRNVKMLPAAYVEDFRRIASKVFDLRGGLSPRRFYVTRRGARGRRLMNDAEVSDSLGRRGFSTVALEDLPIPEQARIFADAEVIVAQHGAGLTNLLYAKPGTKVLEIFNGARAGGEGAYKTLASVLGLEYHSLQLDGPHKDTDVILSIEQLSSALEQMQI